MTFKAYGRERNVDLVRIANDRICRHANPSGSEYLKRLVQQRRATVCEGTVRVSRIDESSGAGRALPCGDGLP